MALDDFEDGPPALQPPERSYPETGPTLPPPAAFAGPDEKTNPAIRPTMQIPKAQLDALNAAIADGHKASTAEIVGALDRMVGALLKRADETDAKIDQLRADVKTWLFGEPRADGVAPRSIAGDLGVLREQMDSVIPMASEAKTGMHRIEKVLTETHDAVLSHNRQTAGEHESERPELAVVSGSGRSDR